VSEQRLAGRVDQSGRDLDVIELELELDENGSPVTLELQGWFVCSFLGSSSNGGATCCMCAAG
jgi:hypothetical protein